MVFLLGFRMLEELSAQRPQKPGLKVICESLFTEMRVALLYESISNDCVQQFCQVMENFSQYYILETNMLHNYYTILVLDVSFCGQENL